MPKLKWEKGQPPWTDGEAMLFQVDLSDGSTETFIGRVDDDDTMVHLDYLDYGEDIGWQADSVDRWILLEDVLAAIR